MICIKVVANCIQLHVVIVREGGENEDSAETDLSNNFQVKYQSTKVLRQLVHGRPESHVLAAILPRV